jgi:hypothetical protein
MLISSGDSTNFGKIKGSPFGKDAFIGITIVLVFNPASTSI